VPLISKAPPILKRGAGARTGELAFFEDLP